MKEIEKSHIQLRIQLNTFDSVEEVLAFPLTKVCIERHISNAKSARFIRPNAGPGRRYIRDGFDIMSDNGEMNVEFMLTYFADVHNKVSPIPRIKRDTMLYICGNAINEVLKSCTVIVVQGDKMNVVGSRAKLTVLRIMEQDSTIEVQLLKVKEIWPVAKFVQSVKDGTLYK